MPKKRSSDANESTSKKGRTEPIDMRSDTVTKPTQKMREAMAAAVVGDDVWGDDPTVIKLQDTAASMFGKEAALFVPSGTMGNLISIMVHCELRGSEMIVGDQCHMVVYEQGGSAAIAGVHPRTVPTQPDGTLLLADLEAAIRVDNDHFPITRLVCLESTHNKKGGTILSPEYIDSVGEFAKQHGLKMHLDGARVMNAVVGLGIDVARYVKAFDSVNICLSKGLGAPVGSLLVGTKEFIRKARRARKVLGGGMRQSGVLAAAGLIALNEMPAVLKQDHANTTALFKGLEQMQDISVAAAPQSNMVYATVSLPDGRPAQDLVDALAAQGVLISAIDKHVVRFVLHHQVSAEDVKFALEAIQDAMIHLKAK